MIESTLICSLGMLALCLSSFEPTARFGLLMSAQMLASTLGELVLLPAMLCCRPLRASERASENVGQSSAASSTATVLDDLPAARNIPAPHLPGFTGAAPHRDLQSQADLV